LRLTTLLGRPEVDGRLGRPIMHHALRVEAITKTYGSTVANDDVTCELRSGEVRGLLGQNGAGKSTLVGVLTGHVTPERGHVLLDNTALDITGPADSLNAGIAAVYQNLLLVPSMTGIENIALALGQSPSQRLRERLRQLSDRYELPLQLDVPVQHLDMAARQRVEFARALCQEPRFLLLDEPTTFLPPTHVDDFLVTIRRLAEHGLAVLLITHRLDEARRVCDRVTVLRGGRVVTSYDRASLPNNQELALAMLGERVNEPHAYSAPDDTVVLAVRGLCTEDGNAEVGLVEVGLDLRRGEIVGIAGVDGNGQVELLEAIGGLRPATGSVTLAGREVSGLAYASRFRLGLQLLSGDRQRYGIVPTFSVFDHFDYALPAQDRQGVVHELNRLSVVPADPDVRADALSGGNQQKLMLARALVPNPKVLLLVYPTQGLDVRAAAVVKSLLIERARTGLSFVVLSSDLDELLAICDRVVVMYRGRIVGEQGRGSFEHETLAEWFTGLGV